MVDCEQPTRAPTKLRFRRFQRFILSRLTVGAQIRHGNPPFLRLTAEFVRSEKPATSRAVPEVQTNPEPEPPAAAPRPAERSAGEGRVLPLALTRRETSCSCVA